MRSRFLSTLILQRCCLSCKKFVVVGVKILRQQEVFLTEERPYPPLLLHRSAGPALPQPVDNL